MSLTGNKFFEALTTKNLRTENNMPTHSSSGSFVVDLFYEMGAYRKNAKPLNHLVALFYSAFGENPNLALKALLHLRDIRGGMGEIDSPRILLHFLAKSHPEIVEKLIPCWAEFGRWDDILVLLDTPVENVVLEEIRNTLVGEKNLKTAKLCAKWMPRENKSQGHIAVYLAQKFGLSRSRYRKLLAGMTDVVETKMCKNMWSEIKFSSVPSVAMKNYRKAFKKHTPELFEEYLTSVEKGEQKINTGALSPVDIVEKYGYTMDRTLEALWSNLPNVVPPGLSFLPICDLSGSMAGTPMSVSKSLGIYLAQRNKSIFKNAFITFSQHPDFVYLTGKTLRENLNIMGKVNLAQNTDLEAVFRLILESAIRANLSVEDMPKNLLIISDMQFDECLGKNRPNGSYGRNSLAEPFSDTALEMIDSMYHEAGYERPGIFFWNVRASEGIPAKIQDNNVALVSGYSPNLLRSVLTADFNPLTQVQAILNNGRYNVVDKIL